MSEARPSTVAIVAAFGAVYLFWGTTYLAIRYLVAEWPPMLSTAIRCAGGAVLLGGWAAWRGGGVAVLRGTRRQWRTAAIAGALLFVPGQGLLAWAEQHVASGRAALVMTSIPLWMVVLSCIRDRRAPTAGVVAALTAGTCGVGLLVGGTAWHIPPADLAALIASAASWALGSLVAREGTRPASATAFTAMQLAAGGVWLTVAGTLSGELAAWDPHITTRGVASLAFLIVCGTTLGFGAYSWLLTVTSAEAASSYAFVNPVVALMLAWAMGDEALTGRTLLAAALVLASVVLTRRSSKAHGGRSAVTPAPPLPAARAGCG
jgi:drug/metabolite transporter (DMT)-like permease